MLGVGVGKERTRNAHNWMEITHDIWTHRMSYCGKQECTVAGQNSSELMGLAHLCRLS